MSGVFTITEEQWEKTVDNWIRRVTKEPFSDEVVCGFCDAARVVAPTEYSPNICEVCPANEEICTDEVCQWYEWGGDVQVGLKVLEWLYEFGRLAEWC